MARLIINWLTFLEIRLIKPTPSTNSYFLSAAKSRPFTSLVDFPSKQLQQPRSIRLTWPVSNPLLHGLQWSPPRPSSLALRQTWPAF